MTARYHHGDLRRELVLQAVALAREKGETGVVVREAARNAGVSHNAAYRHFKDRDALIVAVAQVGMEELAVRMRSAAARVRGEPRSKAIRRLRAIGRTYVEFAWWEPGLFEVAFAAAAAGQPEQVDGIAGPYQLLGEALDALVETGASTAKRRTNAEILCWSAVHGFAVLCLEGPLATSTGAERDDALDDLLDQIERSLTGQEALTSADEEHWHGCPSSNPTAEVGPPFSITKGGCE